MKYIGQLCNNLRVRRVTFLAGDEDRKRPNCFGLKALAASSDDLRKADPRHVFSPDGGAGKCRVLSLDRSARKRRVLSLDRGTRKRCVPSLDRSTRKCGVPNLD